MKEDSLSLTHTLSLSFFKGPKPSYRSACEGRVVLSTRGVAAGVPACVGVLVMAVCGVQLTAVRGGGCLSVRFLTLQDLNRLLASSCLYHRACYTRKP